MSSLHRDVQQHGATRAALNNPQSGEGGGGGEGDSSKQSDGLYFAL